MTVELIQRVGRPATPQVILTDEDYPAVPLSVTQARILRRFLGQLVDQAVRAER